MDEKEIVLRVPAIDFNFPAWYYLIAWSVLCWLVLGPWMSRSFYRYWMIDVKPDSRLASEAESSAFFIWFFAPVTVTFYVVFNILYYPGKFLHIVMCKMIFG